EFSRDRDRILIGKPIRNVNCFIIDRNRQFVPVGVVGELYLTGKGIARGYLNNPELTNEKFINYKLQKTIEEITRDILHKAHSSSNEHEKGQQSQQHGTNNSFSPNNQSQITNNYIYRTGDLARWLPDGNIEFLDRIDDQVKIRGFRIELGEIENRLLTHPEIKEAVVLASESKDGDKFLCAYYVPENIPEPASDTKQPESGIQPSAGTQLQPS
ncbi:MAG: amino acid adenylation domain-containing protein, partial [bacterium]|nr:amino acid adenylation domain-containing protein [bacterium]